MIARVEGVKGRRREVVVRGKTSDVVCGAYSIPRTLCFGYLLLTGLAAAAAFSSARNMRVLSRNAIFCFLSLLKRAVSPQVFDI